MNKSGCAAIAILLVVACLPFTASVRAAEPTIQDRLAPSAPSSGGPAPAASASPARDAATALERNVGPNLSIPPAEFAKPALVPPVEKSVKWTDWPALDRAPLSSSSTPNVPERVRWDVGPRAFVLGPNIARTPPLASVSQFSDAPPNLTDDPVFQPLWTVFLRPQFAIPLEASPQIPANANDPFVNRSGAILSNMPSDRDLPSVSRLRPAPPLLPEKVGK